MQRFLSYRFRENTASNRVVVPPMASGLADGTGSVTERTLEHYLRLSESGAGLIFVEYSFVHPSGKSESNQLGIDSDDKIPGLRRLAEIIKSNGSLAGIQLVHAGGKIEKSLREGKLLGPSAIRVPTKDRDLDVPLEMSFEEIGHYKTWYLEAAGRASAAGFDFVELHAAHGYGLNQWLSPLTNQRQDSYGGTALNRGRLLREIVQDIRANYPHLLVSVRMPLRDHIDEGIRPCDMIELAKDLELLGVDLIDVSSGIGGWRRPEGRDGEGYLVEDAASLKNEILIPVIGVGGIETGEYIDKKISEGSIDFAAVGRAILKGPKDWRLNVMRFMAFFLLFLNTHTFAQDFYANKDLLASYPGAFALDHDNLSALGEIKHNLESVRVLAEMIRQNQGLFDKLKRFELLSLEDKVETLEEVFEIEVKFLGIKRPELQIDTTSIKGYAYFEFDPHTSQPGKVYLNKEKLQEEKDPSLFINLLLHETRHSYQLQKGKGTYHKAFLTQQELQRSGRKMSFCDFMLLMNEYEAFQFANYLMGELFGFSAKITDMGTLGSQFDEHGKLQMDLEDVLQSSGDAVERFNELSRKQFKALYH